MGRPPRFVGGRWVVSGRRKRRTLRVRGCSSPTFRNPHSAIRISYQGLLFTNVPRSAFRIPHFPPSFRFGEGGSKLPNPQSEIRVSHLSCGRSPPRVLCCQLGAVIYDRTIVFKSTEGGLGFSSYSSALLDRHFWSDR